jgi:nascent polypeptide-associated complex subunit alpha
MMPGLNPKKMQAMMKQLGIKQEEIDATRVIIEKEDGKIIIENPSVLKVNMQGQETYQISGDVTESEESEENVEEEEENQAEKDIAMIAEKTGKDKDEIAIVLEKNNGDIAATIMELNE